MTENTQNPNEENQEIIQEQILEETVQEKKNLFEELGLAPELCQAVAELGYTEPTSVQVRAIPLALPAEHEHDGFNDLMVSSQTGSGKTAAFLLPVLHTLINMQEEKAAKEKQEWDEKVAAALAEGKPAPKKPRRKNPIHSRNFKPAVPGALVLCPTRELAQQVAADAIDLVRHCKGMRIANIVGGVPYNVQIARLQNANLIVATPGRLLDLANSGQIKLDEVRFLVVDEADRMLDLGFSDDLAQIHELTQNRQQTMMFSATFAPRIQQLAMRVMHDGGKKVQKVEVATPKERHANIRQELYWADSYEHKRRILDYWLRDPDINQAIVFACTQIECEEMAENLQQSGFAAVSLHGALSQSVRNRRLNALREGKVQILVATDVAARGIDVPTITHVINFGLPMKAEDYTHRIGRTGRAGRDGLAITLAEFRDRRRLHEIEMYTQQHFRPLEVDGLEPTRFFPPINQKAGKSTGKSSGKPSGKSNGKFGGKFKEKGRGGERRSEEIRSEGRGERRSEGRNEGRNEGKSFGKKQSSGREFPRGEFGREGGRGEGGRNRRDERGFSEKFSDKAGKAHKAKGPKVMKQEKPTKAPRVHKITKPAKAAKPYEKA